jgi:hypothetical protein
VQTPLPHGAPTGSSEAVNFAELDTPDISQCAPELCLETLTYANPRTENHAWSSSTIFRTNAHSIAFTDPENSPDALSTLVNSLPGFITDIDRMTDAPKTSTNDHIPRSLTLNLRALCTRPKLNPAAQVTANHMTRILHSYPRMLLSYNTPPPFIHPQWISASSTEAYLEPLANCMSLLGMLRVSIKKNSSLFWRNVRMECDRLSSSYETLDEYGVLAALQALLVYMLIRLAEGETEHNNHDAALLSTMTLMLHQLQTKTHYQFQPLDLQPAELVYNGEIWSKWILDESRRRMSILFRIVNMLVSIEPASVCTLSPGLVLAPLPARKQLWEASGEEQWISELHRTSVVNSGFGLAVNGDLVTMDEYQMKLLSVQVAEPWTSSRSKENWEEWCAGMDGFGALIMLAASLPT